MSVFHTRYFVSVGLAVDLIKTELRKIVQSYYFWYGLRVALLESISSAGLGLGLGLGLGRNVYTVSYNWSKKSAFSGPNLVLRIYISRILGIACFIWTWNCLSHCGTCYKSANEYSHLFNLHTVSLVDECDLFGSNKITFLFDSSRTTIIAANSISE